MTAVEWLYQILHEQNYIYEDMSEYLKQAKKMEKKQIMDAWLITKPTTFNSWKKEFEQYYNKTYKNTNK